LTYIVNRMEPRISKETSDIWRENSDRIKNTEVLNDQTSGKKTEEV